MERKSHLGIRSLSEALLCVALSWEEIERWSRWVFDTHAQALDSLELSLEMSSREEEGARW